MNSDERTLLAAFLRDLDGARGGPKDAEADALIRQSLAANPDAAYLLVQHAIVADQSLHAAQARIAELEGRLRDGDGRQGGFLPQPGGAWGRPDERAAPPQGGYGQGGGQGGGYGYAPPPPEQRPGIFSGGGGLGSFLRNAGTTAAGVAGGEMLFSGLSNLFGGHGGGFGGGGYGGDREEVVVNNFVDDDGRDDDRGDDDGNYGPGDPAGW